MGFRRSSHQLSNGLFVSGPPAQPRERQPTMTSRAVPYTGGDISTSGELGKMFDVSRSEQGPRKSSSSSSQLNTGPVRCGSGSGPLGRTTSSGSGSDSASGPLGRTTSSGSGSGSITQVQPTGLFTSGPLGSSVSRRSAQVHLEHSPSMGKTSYGSVVTNLSEDPKMGFNVSKSVMWTFVVFIFMCLMVGAFLTVAIKNITFLIAVVAILALVLMSIVWNCCWKTRGLLGFLKRYKESDLSGAVDGQCVKVSGVVTCGIVPLETSFQKIPRCVYVSTELYEYKGWDGASAHSKHRTFTWGCRYAERYITDFYISDIHSGLRAAVKAGNGSKSAVLVESANVLDVTEESVEISPGFLQWLSNRGLSVDDRIMRLKEGYIKEGSVVSVMGVLRRHENVLMIVPPPDPISTGCQWIRWLLPTYIEGLVLACSSHDNNTDVIPV